MSNCGSFSPEAYRAFSDGIANPTNFMVMAPAAHPHHAKAPSSYFMDESCGECEEEEEDHGHFESNARMAMGQLRSMADDILVILSEMTPHDNLEPWVAAKITMSKQNLSAVADYLKYSGDEGEEECEEVEEDWGHL